MLAILSYIREMLPYMVAALPFILLARFGYNRIRGVQKSNLFHEIGVVAFLLFMTALFSQTILTFLYTGPVVTRSFTNLNLVPLRVSYLLKLVQTKPESLHPESLNKLNQLHLKEDDNYVLVMLKM